jgi:hypothetical protein
MKFIIAQDSPSRAWTVAPDNFPAVNRLDAALFQNESLTPGAKICGNDIFALLAVMDHDIRTCNLTVDKRITDFTAGLAQGYRQGLLDSFDDFLQQANALEGGLIHPGGLSLIRGVLAHHLPVTFAESLYLHYGFFQGTTNKIQSYIDLQAGMRLRIEGDLGAGQSAYQLVESLRADGTPQLGLDAFFASTELPKVDTNTGGDKSAIDLASALKLRRFVRLCYPPNMPSSDAAVSQNALERVTLLGADTLVDLNSATNDYYQARAITKAGVLVSSFRGRTIAIPEIAMLLNGAPLYVPVGTSVRQALSRFTVVPRLAGFRPAFPYRRFAADTQFTGDDIQDAYPEDFYHTVSFQSGTQASGPQDAFDLPVLAGDSYRFNIE